MRKGVIYATNAYILWGLLPIFWKALGDVPALEILAHRMVWSLGFVLLLLAYQRHWRWLGRALRSWRIVLTFLITALLLSMNWFIYIWAVNEGHVVETSLGYFINPLVNVLLGVLVLKERLRLGQAGALLIALGGVIYLTLNYAGFPWIAIALASSFGIYGLLRKTSALTSLEGLTLETLFMLVPALVYLLALGWSGGGAFGNSSLSTTLLLVISGAATSLPLLLFASGARRIPMTLLGVLQYLAPTLQFLLGVLAYGEELTQTRLVGFGLIWLALLLYSVEGLVQSRRRLQQRAVEV